MVKSFPVPTVERRSPSGSSALLAIQPLSLSAGPSPQSHAGAGPTDSFNASILLKQFEYGKYRCVASNEEGLSPASVEVTVRPPSSPDCPSGFNALQQSIGAESVVLRWTPSFDGGRSQLFVVHYLHADSSQGSQLASGSRFQRLAAIECAEESHCEYNVTDLMPNTRYQFFLTAQNALGESGRTPLLDLTTRYMHALCSHFCATSR